MGDLDARYGTMALDDIDQRFQRRAMFVIPDAQTAMADAPARLHPRGLDKNGPYTAAGIAAVMHQMPIVGDAVDGGILTQRRHHDAVARGNGFNGDGLKQQG